jgi:hypothetical protein
MSNSIWLSAHVTKRLENEASTVVHDISQLLALLVGMGDHFFLTSLDVICAVFVF